MYIGCIFFSKWEVQLCLTLANLYLGLKSSTSEAYGLFAIDPAREDSHQKVSIVKVFLY